MQLRPAKLSDDFLLSWRNDSETRVQSHEAAEVSPAEHRQWFVKSLANPLRSIWIAEIDNQPVATIRVDWDDAAHSKYEISYTVAPEHRGKGIGSQLVRETIDLPELKDATVVAKVKRSNLASQRIFEKAGLKLIVEDGEILTYCRRPHATST